jgi:hypothetical protein
MANPKPRYRRSNKDRYMQGPDAKPRGTGPISARNQRRIDRKKAALKAAKEMFKP